MHGETTAPLSANHQEHQGWWTLADAKKIATRSLHACRRRFCRSDWLIALWVSNEPGALTPRQADKSVSDGMPIRLHKFGEAWGIADPSPFCVKVETFLREANLAYEVVPFAGRRSFAKAPKGKLPFIEDEDGTVVGDSTLIIGRLSRRHGIDLDAPLDDRQRCVSLAFRRMLDEHLYWVEVYSRWIDEPGWSNLRQLFFAKIPAPVRPVVAALTRRGVASDLRAQGTGRHSRDEIYAFGSEDVRSLSRLLGNDACFFAASRPTLLDLWAHAFIAEIVAPPIESPLKETTRALTNLTDHFNRLQARLYA